VPKEAFHAHFETPNSSRAELDLVRQKVIIDSFGPLSNEVMKIQRVTDKNTLWMNSSLSLK